MRPILLFLKQKFWTNKRSSQLDNPQFWEKRRESIDYDLNINRVKFRGPFGRKSGAKKYFKFYKSLKRQKTYSYHGIRTRDLLFLNPKLSPLRHKDLLLKTIIFLWYGENFFPLVRHPLTEVPSYGPAAVVKAADKKNEGHGFESRDKSMFFAFWRLF